MTAQMRKILALLAFSALTLTACGGGGGYGGGANPPPPPPPPPPPTGGIVRTGVAIAVGEITGFGSIIVNGNHYETGAQTQYVKDDNPSSEDQFKVGHMVLIKGTINDDNTGAKAEMAEVEETVEGPASGVDTGTNTFLVLGQVVQYSPGQTSIDNNCNTTTDITLLPGFAAVEVFGPYDANGVIQATRIECKAVMDVDGFEINGVVSNHDPNAKTFNINALLVDYSATPQVQDFPGSVINDGDPVEAEGPDFEAGPPAVFRPAKVEFKGNRFADDEGDHIEIEGFITDFVASPLSFKILGITVLPNSNTVYEGGAASDLGLNVKVEAEGEFNADGALVPTKIEIKQAKNVRVVGVVDSANGTAGTFVILGITVTTDELKTRLEDKRDDVDPFRVSDMAAGDYVEARGQEIPAGSGQIAALIVERDKFDERTELRGFVEAFEAGAETLQVLGVTIDASSPTVVLRDSNGVPFATRADFWAAIAVGTPLIDVNGTETATRELLATEVKIEAEDSP